MKIGIESQRIFRRGKHGMDVVALELIRQLQRLDLINEYLVFARKGPDTTCITETRNFRTRIIPGLTYPDWEQIALPSVVKKLKPDLLHCTGNTAPLNCPVPLVLTLHDIIYLEETNFKGSAYQNFGNIYRKLVVPPAVKKARTIITVSDHEKEVIVDKCKVDPSKVTVIRNAVDGRFHPGYSKEKLEKFAISLGLPPRFILHLGNTAPKKNTAGVVKAYVHYCSHVNDPVPVVIVDYQPEKIKQMLREINRPELITNFYFPGYVPSEDMPLLYNSCTVFLYPSLRESFGLPVLEAMACGIPVISSKIPAIMEVAGEAAELVDPSHPLAIAEAIQQFVNDESLRDVYKQKGLARASLFSWEISAKKLLDVYITIMASP